MLKSLSLTHVEYTEGDIIGKILALITLSPIFFIVSYTTLILVNRQSQTICLLLGQLLNELINYILKQYIKQERPGDLGTGYGMPSSHSQFSCFLMVYGIMHVIHFDLSDSRVYKTLVILMLIFQGVLVPYSRIYLGYHDIQQVVVGFGLGGIVGLIWFRLLVFKKFGFLFRSSFCRFFGLVDSSVQMSLKKKK